MLTLDEAKSIAVQYSLQSAPKGADLVVLDECTRVKPYGWVMIVNTRAFALSGDMLNDALIGWGPVIVRHSGKVDILGSGGAPGRMVAEFEKKHGLRAA